MDLTGFDVLFEKGHRSEQKIAVKPHQNMSK